MIYSVPSSTDGDDAAVMRYFPLFPRNIGPDMTDPFLLLDHFFIMKPSGFPSHPHKGFEIITYVLEGGVQHKDSSGNVDNIEEGAAQRIVTGSGIVHSEMPLGDGITSGIQLWINLPRNRKDSVPEFITLTPQDVPVTHEGEVTVRKIAGEGTLLKSMAEVEFYHVIFEEESDFVLPLKYGQALFLVTNGEVSYGGETVGKDQICFLEGNTVIRGDRGSELLFLDGKPLNQDVVFNGPFVL